MLPQIENCKCEFCNSPEAIREHIGELVDTHFASRNLHNSWKSRVMCGSQIPKSWLRDHKRVSQLCNVSINDAVEKVYNWTGPRITAADQKNARTTGDATWDIVLVNETLQLLVRDSIPQKYAGGMLLMHLELCEGLFVD
jgi:hypothetical protein